MEPQKELKSQMMDTSKFTSDGTYDGYSNASQAHEFRQSLNKPTLWVSNSSSVHTWDIIRTESARSNNSAFQFIVTLLVIYPMMSLE